MLYTHQRGLPVLFEWVTTPPGAANLAGRHRCLHRELDLLNTKNLPLKVVSSVESNKLKHRFIGPFAVPARHGAAYTIDLPKSMATHPTFYVGRLKRYHEPLGLSPRTEKHKV
ncbi:Pol protein [Phytophthora palmivora]|uniref:Pol protein n=1 Tax=Phytophthora palmivora TaxID=4796 RepID=A0A2P4X6K2_9STRA|nr:Pol protein [Phytophthora palmivora]